MCRKRELAFVLLNPHTLAKSRTGGVVARYLARTDLNLVSARMFNPPVELVERYADMLENAPDGKPEVNKLLGDYVRTEYGPNPVTGRPRRVLMLLFEGEDAVAKIWRVTGSATLRKDCGETVRETYGEFIQDEAGNVRYFEPAVLVAPNPARASRTLKLWGQYSASHGGIAESSSDYPEGEIHRTMVLLKPDNFRIPSLRPGSIVDVLSSSGLRIVGVKKFRMSVQQAEEFYAPVRVSLSSKFVEHAPERVAKALSNELGFGVPEEDVVELCAKLGERFADHQFHNIVMFMTGHAPTEVLEDDKEIAGHEECLALVYKGVNAVDKIRGILGSTDPSKAKPGSVRREFGSSIMVNAAHASDSPESAEREIGIIDMQEDTVASWIEQYC